ncbi:hypothetical protein Tco_0945217 [Tanacetum coccineum]
MRRMVNVIAVIKKTYGPLTPSATKLLKVAMDKANKYTVGFNGGKSMRSCKVHKDPMNATSTSTSQISTNVAASTRKRPFDAGTTPSTAPAKKKQATRSSNAGTTPSTAFAKKKQAATGSGQNR